MRPSETPWLKNFSRHAFSPCSHDSLGWENAFQGLLATLWVPSVFRYKKFADEVLARIDGEDIDSRAAKRTALPPQTADVKNAADDLTETFVLVCRALQRTLQITPYACQIVAARIMLDGRVAEMATGEGKTVAIGIAAAVAALKRTPVHVVTANDYLASRDSDQLAPFFSSLGLTTGAVTQPMEIADRRVSWGRDITYCSAKELVFDHLRESLSGTAGLSDLERRARQLSGVERIGIPLLRGLRMAIVDEIDTVLIDEASVPLVLSRRPTDSPQQDFLEQAASQAARLRAGYHFDFSAESNDALLTSAGRRELQAWPPSTHAVYNQKRHRETTVALALTALHKLQRDRDYLVVNDQVTIIDETNGRAAIGRAWSRGLHQLVEIKEGCSLTRQNETVAKITYQKFFPRYAHLSGMSGTVRGCAYELASIYGLSVAAVPPRLPRRCRAAKPLFYANTGDLWSAVLISASSTHARGQPVLIGTATVFESEQLSQIFTAAGLTHSVLNARQDEAESVVISDAGNRGHLTIATSMAGRGTDIKLGQGVSELGGLHVILCQHNVSARIDRQFLGRAARQGEPGSVEILLALDFPMLHFSLTNVTYTVLRKYSQGCLRVLASLLQWRASDLARRRRLNLLRSDAETEQEFTFNRDKFS